MKLPKKATAQIDAALSQLRETQSFIMEDKTRIVRVYKDCTALPEDKWTNGVGKTGIAITKEIGSKLCQLWNAIETLERLKTPVIVETEVQS